jgi:hypothetical protein
MRSGAMVLAVLALWWTGGCGSQPASACGGEEEGVAARAATLPAAAVAAYPASAAGGFEGARAYEHVRRLVEIGPRAPGSDGIHHAQAYIVGQLKSFGCQVEEHDFHG